MLPTFVVSLLFAIALCVHAVRTGRDSFWLWIILFFPWVGGIIYIVINIVPDIFGGAAAQRVGHVARVALDPPREYREAKAACQETPTVGARSRLAAAAMGLQRYAEAEVAYREAAQGLYADDPVLLVGLANANLELGRPAEALAALERLKDAPEGHAPDVVMALGRAYEGLGRVAEANAALREASERLPGFEALARYAAFMARSGRSDEAREAVTEMDKRLARLRGPFRKEAQTWRDFAARALR